MDSFSKACKDFGLTISLKKTNVMGQDVDRPEGDRHRHQHMESLHTRQTWRFRREATAPRRQAHQTSGRQSSYSVCI